MTDAEKRQLRILKVLAMTGAPTTIGAIMTRTDIHEPLVRRDLIVLNGLGLCIPCGYGLYRVTEAGRTAAKGKAA